IGQGTSDADDETAKSKGTLESQINRDHGSSDNLEDEIASTQANRQSQLALISKTMDELAPEDKQLIELSFVSGLKHREIAKILGKNPKQIGSELIRAKEKLRKLVNKKLLGEKKNL